MLEATRDEDPPAIPLITRMMKMFFMRVPLMAKLSSPI